MICPKCKEGRLRITHSFASAPGIRTQRSRCGHCLTVYTIVSRAEIELPSRGQGAGSLARKWSLQASVPQTEDTSEEGTSSDPT